MKPRPTDTQPLQTWLVSEIAGTNESTPDLFKELNAIHALERSLKKRIHPFDIHDSSEL